MAAVTRRVYVRGLGTHGQFASNSLIYGSKEFVKAELLDGYEVDKIAANYFSSACVTKDNQLFYWGWKFCPYSSFNLLHRMEYIPFASWLAFIRRKFDKRIGNIYKVNGMKEEVDKIVLGNAYAIALGKNGKVVGLGANDAVLKEGRLF